MKIENVFRHCQRCGNKIELKNRFFACLHCGLNYFLAPSVCNAVILLNEKKQILLVKRKYPPKKDYWDLPGGFIEFSESGEESVIRELKEELGITLKTFTYFRSYPGTYLYKGVESKTFCLIYTGEIPNEKLQPMDDVTEIRFFETNKIPYQKVAFPSVKKAIKDFLVI